MAVTEEWVYWKDESHLNLNMQGGLYPKITRSSFPTKYTKLYYCYYTSKPGQSLILAPSGGIFHRALFHPRFDFYLCSLLLQTIQTNIVLYFVSLPFSSFTNHVYPKVFVVPWNFNTKMLNCYENTKWNSNVIYFNFWCIIPQIYSFRYDNTGLSQPAVTNLTHTGPVCTKL